jgi:hypothetical protein
MKKPKPKTAFSAASLKYLGGIITPKTYTSDVTPLPSCYPPDGQFKDALNMGGRPFALDVERREFVMGSRYGRVSRFQIIEPALHTDGNVSTFPTTPHVTQTRWAE